MYGKMFASCFTGSMIGMGADVFAVWAYAVANADNTGTVELNPKLLAACIGSTPEAMKAAIQKLEAPDPDSRNPIHDGRRLLKEGQFQYKLATFDAYQAIKDFKARRAYNAEKQRAYRDRMQAKAMAVTGHQHTHNQMCTHIDIDKDKDNYPPTPLKKGGARRGRRGSHETSKNPWSEEVVALAKQFSDAYPKIGFNFKQDRVPPTHGTQLCDRLHRAIEDVKFGVGVHHDPVLVLRRALDQYLYEAREADSFLVGLGVWLSPTPLPDKANYRTYVRTILTLDRRELLPELGLPEVDTHA